MKRNRLHRFGAAILSWLFVFQSIAVPLPAHAATTLNSASVESIENNTAMIRVSVSGGAYIRVEYGTGANAYTHYAPAPSATATQGSTSWYITSTPWVMPFQLTGLTSNTTYHYRVGVCDTASGGLCVSDLSKYSFGPNQTFTTTAKPGSVGDGKVNYEAQFGFNSSRIVAHDTVTLKWKTPGSVGWETANGPTSYLIKFQKRTGSLFQGPNDGGYWASAAVVPSGQLQYAPAAFPLLKDAVQTITVSGLEPSSQYRFGVLAINAAGVQAGSIGIWDIDTTPPPQDSVPPAQVAGLGVSGKTKDSITLIWTTPLDPTPTRADGPIDHYMVAYRANQFTDADVASATSGVIKVDYKPSTVKAGGVQETHTVNGLTANTAYHFGIKAYDANGNASTLSSLVSDTTLADSATAPAEISGTPTVERTTTTATVKFSITKPTTVRVKYNITSSSASWMNSAPLSIAAGSTLTDKTIALSNLMPSTSYTYGFMFGDAPETTAAPPTPYYTFTTLAPESGLPQGSAGLKLTVKDNTGARVSGGSAEISFCGPTSTTPCFSGQLTPQPSGTDSDFSISGLKGASYGLTVRPPASRPDLDVYTLSSLILTEAVTRQETVILPSKSTIPTTKAPVLSNVYHTSVGATSAMIYFDINTQAMVNAQYRTVASEAWLNGGSVSVTETATMAGRSVMLNGLSPSTSYYYRLVASNSNGTATSQPYTLTTSHSTDMMSLPTGNSSIKIQVLLNNALFPGVTISLSTCGSAPSPSPTTTFPSPSTTTAWQNCKNKWEYSSSGELTFSGIAAGTYYLSVGKPAGRMDLGNIESMPITVAAAENKVQQVSLSTSTVPPPQPPPSTSLPPGPSVLTVYVKYRPDPKLDATAPVSGANVNVSTCLYGMSSPMSTASMTSPTHTSPQACGWANGTSQADGSVVFPGTSVSTLYLAVYPHRSDLDRIEGYTVPLVSGPNTKEIILSPTTMPPQNQVNIYDISTYVQPDGKSVAISWKTDSQSTTQVDYGTSQSYGLSVNDPTLTIYHKIMLSGLAPSTIYYFQVVSKDTSGREGRTGGYTFSTQMGPTTVFAIDSHRSWPQPGYSDVPATLGSIHISFTKPIDQDMAKTAKVRLTVLGTNQVVQGDVRVMYDGIDFMPASPLLPNTTYTFTVPSGSIRDAEKTQTLTNEYSFSFTTSGDRGRKGDGTVKGVVKLPDGTPVRAARLALYPKATPFTSTGSYKDEKPTNDFGEFYFDFIPSGMYILELFLPDSYGSYTKPAPESLEINDATKFHRRDFILTPSAQYTIEGRVTFDTGAGVPDAQVIAYRTDNNQWVPSTDVSSDGSYKIYVQPGTWSVSVRPRMYPMPVPMGPYAASQGSSMGGGATGSMYHSPSIVCFTAPCPGDYQPPWFAPPPQEVVVNKGDTKPAIANFTVTKASFDGKIFGVIKRADEKEIVAGTVKIRLRLGATPYANSSKVIDVPAGGYFEASVGAGWYELFFEVYDSELSNPPPQHIQIARGERKDLGVITIPTLGGGKEPVGIISGVVTKNGESASGIRVLAMRPGRFGHDHDVVSDLTAENGSYTLKVYPGQWMVFPTHPGSTEQFPRPSAKPERIDITAKTKEVSGINFKLLEFDSVIVGTIEGTDRKLLSEATGYVTVRLSNGKPFEQVPGTSVERGTFTLKVPPGKYQIQFEPLPNSQFLPSSPETVSVDKGETQRIALVVKEKAKILTATLTGALVDQKGQKITGVPFVVYAGRGDQWESRDGNKETGEFTMELSAGRWSIGFDIKDEQGEYEPAVRAKNVSLKEGTTRSLNLIARKKNTIIRGTTQNVEGDPIPGVLVILASKPFAKVLSKDEESIDIFETYSNEDGEFDFSVPEGTYYLRSFLPESSEMTNPEEKEIKAKRDGSLSTVLVFKPSNVALKGKVTIGNTGVFARVWAWSDKGGYVQTRSLETGEYELPIAARDLWHVSAVAELNGIVYRASEVTRKVGTEKVIELPLGLVSLDVRIPSIASTNGDAAKPLIIENEIGVKTVLPPNAVSTEGTITATITPEVVPASQGTERVLGNIGYDIRVKDANQLDVTSFNSKLLVSLPYDPVEVSRLGLRPEELIPSFWNGSSWQRVDNAVVDAEHHAIICSTNHLTRFALLASTKVTPPTSLKGVSLTSAKGAVTFTGLKLGKDLAYAKIYRSIKKGDLGELALNNIKTPSAKDVTAAAGKQYYYTIRVVDTLGNESINTNQLTIKTPTAKATKPAKKAAVRKKKK